MPFSDLRDEIERRLETLRSALQLDGGDARLVEISDDGEVRIALVGRCAGCAISRVVLQMGIDTLVRGLSGVTRVVTVDERLPKAR